MNTLLTVLGMIPTLIKAIQAVEELVPLPGNGKAKLDLVTGIISDVYPDASKIQPQVSTVISRIVAFANALGIFKTSTPSPAA